MPKTTWKKWCLSREFGHLRWHVPFLDITQFWGTPDRSEAESGGGHNPIKWTPGVFRCTLSFHDAKKSLALLQWNKKSLSPFPLRTAGWIIVRFASLPYDPSHRIKTWIYLGYRALRMFLQSLVSPNTGWLVLAKVTNQMGNDVVCI